MPKTQLLCTSAKLNLGDRVFGEVEKQQFFCFARQRGTQWAPALKNCVSQLGGFGEFYSNSSRVGLLIRLGCVQGLHTFNLVSGNLLMGFSGFFNLASDGLLQCSSLVSESSSFSDQQLFESAFWDSGRSQRLQSVPCKQGTRDAERILCPRAPEGPAQFHNQSAFLL